MPIRKTASAIDPCNVLAEEETLEHRGYDTAKYETGNLSPKGFARQGRSVEGGEERMTYGVCKRVSGALKGS